MKKFIALLLLILLQFVFVLPQKAYAVTPPDRTFGITDTYSVYGHTGITNTGTGTRVWGNVGGNGAGTSGFTSTNVPSGIIDNSTATGTAIELDARSVYDSLMSATQGTPTGLDLAGTHTTGNGNPVTPGVYTVGATTMNGAFELSGAGVYIFRSDSSATIATSGTAVMTLTNGATACNVFWAIPASMTIGTGAHIEGTIIASTGLISLATGATLVGRAISLVAQVTLDTNQITQPICVAAAPSLTTAGSSSYCPPISSQIVTPNIIESRRVDADSVFISWGPYSGSNTFNVRYGTENGKWLYSTNVTGFSTTINNLPANTPIWVEVAVRNDCAVGSYGAPMLVGGPGLPNTGFAPSEKSIAWYIPAGILITISTLLVLIQRKQVFSSGH